MRRDDEQLREEDVEPAPGVSHEATVENSVGRISTWTRKCRMMAGWPTMMWPLLLAAYCLHLIWFSVAGTPLEVLRGEWEPIPTGATVLYLPRDSARTRCKRDT